MSRDPKFIGTELYPLHASSLVHVIHCPWRVVAKYQAEPDEPEETSAPEPTPYGDIDVLQRAKCPQSLEREQKKYSRGKRSETPRVKRKRRPR